MYLVKFVWYLHNSTGVPVVQFWLLSLSLCHVAWQRERGQNWTRLPGILCTVGKGTKYWLQHRNNLKTRISSRDIAPLRRGTDVFWSALRCKGIMGRSSSSARSGWFIRVLKQQLFWATHVNRKWAFFSLNMPWHGQICIAKCLYSYRDDLPKNLLKITAQVWKKSTSGWPALLKNVAA